MHMQFNYRLAQVKSIYERVSRLEKILSMAAIRKTQKNDRTLKFSTLVQSAAFSTQARLEWQSSLLLLFQLDSESLVSSQPLVLST